MPPRASNLLPSANVGGYRAKRRRRIEQASSWRRVRREPYHSPPHSRVTEELDLHAMDLDAEKNVARRGGSRGRRGAVPEPSTWAMMLAGFGGLALFAVRRRRSLSPIG
jgi:hypothetical protein